MTWRILWASIYLILRTIGRFPVYCIAYSCGVIAIVADAIAMTCFRWLDVDLDDDEQRQR